MKFSLVVIAILAIAAVNAVFVKTDVKYADKSFLAKQKFIFEVLHNLHAPIQNQDYVEDIKGFVQGKDYYTNYEKVYKFFMMYKEGFLPKNYVFTVFNYRHLQEMKGLFYLFYYSKDWNAFYTNVLWARHNINAGVFVYALSASIIHSKDLQGIVLPSHNEIFPHLYYNGFTINKIMNYKTQGFNNLDNGFIVTSNYTNDFMMLNNEAKMAYFTEDIGWNMYYYYFNLDYPFWLGGKEFDLYKDRRGENYLYQHQQLLARYYLERLSNNLGHIPEISWSSPIKTGYNPFMINYNGLPFTYRKNYYEVYTTENYNTLNRIDDFERRIRDIIDLGYFTTIDGGKVDLMSQEGVDMLGNIIQSNPDSINERFFGKLFVYAQQILGGSSSRGTHDYTVVPSVLEHFETSLRDPVFYQFFKRIVRLYLRMKENFAVYKPNELFYSGVVINNVDISKLVTYFDYYVSDVSTLMETDAKYVQHNTVGGSDYVQTHSPSVHPFYTDAPYAVKSYADKSNADKSYMDNYYMYHPYHVGKSYVDKRYPEQSYGVDKSYGVDYDNSMHYDSLNVGSDYDPMYKTYAAHSDKFSTSAKADNTFYRNFKVRQLRLNHKPFTMNIDITSDTVRTVVFRMYMGPKYNNLGKLLTINENRENFVEIDQFVYDLKSGRNTIKRNSWDFYYSVKDRTMYSDLYKNVMLGLQGSNYQFPLDMSEAHCGFPDRLLLPKGWVGGMPIQFFFIVTPFQNNQQFAKYPAKYSCGIGSGTRYIDSLPFGYPFDRYIDETYFFTPNMFFKDARVYHQTEEQHEYK